MKLSVVFMYKLVAGNSSAFNQINEAMFKEKDMDFLSSVVELKSKCIKWAILFRFA